MTPELEVLNQRTREGLQRARAELEQLLQGSLIIETAEAIQAAVDCIKVAEEKHSRRPMLCDVCGDLCKPDESPEE